MGAGGGGARSYTCCRCLVGWGAGLCAPTGGDRQAPRVIGFPRFRTTQCPTQSIIWKRKEGRRPNENRLSPYVHWAAIQPEWWCSPYRLAEVICSLSLAAPRAVAAFTMQILRRKLLEASRRLPLFSAAVTTHHRRAHAVAVLAAPLRDTATSSLTAAPWAATQRRGAKMLGSDVRIPLRALPLSSAALRT